MAGWTAAAAMASGARRRGRGGSGGAFAAYGQRLEGTRGCGGVETRALAERRIKACPVSRGGYSAARQV